MLNKKFILPSAISFSGFLFLVSMDSVIVLGVAGGSCSGKTTLTHFLKSFFGADSTILAQDSFYIDQSHKFDRDGGSVNFDHPSSIDFALMGECVKGLKKNLEVSIPIYDFATHKRSKEVQKISGTKIRAKMRKTGKLKN